MAARRAVAAAALLGLVPALVLAGCTGGSSADTTPSPTLAPTTATASPSSASPTTARPVVRHTVAAGLDVPWSVVVLPDGSSLVSLRAQARIVHITTRGQVMRVPTSQG